MDFSELILSKYNLKRIMAPPKAIGTMHDCTKLASTNIIEQDRSKGKQIMNNAEELARHAKAAAALLKELGNENRLIICCCLGDEEMNVGELNERIPLSQSALSQHLARLREAGIVATRKESQTVYYRLAANEALNIITTLKSIYCPD